MSDIRVEKRERNNSFRLEVLWMNAPDHTIQMTRCGWQVLVGVVVSDGIRVGISALTTIEWSLQVAFALALHPPMRIW
jgi:hypothetical protein